MTLGYYRKHIIEKLEAAGCQLKKRGAGDYDLWYSPLSQHIFQIDDVVESHHLANAILKNAGLPQEFGQKITNHH